MRTLYIRFLLPIIAILIIATIMVLTPFAMHTGVAAPTSHNHSKAVPTQLARNYGG